jgi:adenosylcobinamide-GDP ribazoletransferase
MAVGTLSVLPVRAPVVDKATAGRAMVLAPLVGLLLWVPAGGLLWAAGELGLSPLLAAALAVGLLALLTRGMHLDGLADTADGLGSGQHAESALAVMRRSDIGPFGVVTLLLVLLVQVAALAQLTGSGHGPAAVGAALVVSRLVLPLACLRGVPAARAEGLGSAVAGSVTLPMGLLAVLLGFAALAMLTLGTGSDPWVTGLAPVGLVAGAALGARAVRRLGGVTGDVLGACVEATFTAALVAACLA